MKLSWFTVCAIFLSGFHLNAQVGIDCSCDLPLPNGLNSVHLMELPDSTLAASYLTASGPAAIIRRICDGKGQVIDSISIPYKGKPFFVGNGSIYLMNGVSITKLGFYGDTIWNHINTAEGIFSRSMIELKNGGLIVVGGRTKTSQGYSITNATILKYSASGELLWFKDHFYGYDTFEAVYPAPGDSLFYSKLSIQGSGQLLQFDSLGKVRWIKQLGGQFSGIWGLTVLEDGNVLFTNMYFPKNGTYQYAWYALSKYGPQGNFIKSKSIKEWIPDTLASEIITGSGPIEVAPHKYVFYYLRKTPGLVKNLVFVTVNEDLDSLCTETYTKEIAYTMDLMGFTRLNSGKLGWAFKSGNTFKVSNNLVICGEDFCDDGLAPVDTLGNPGDTIIIPVDTLVQPIDTLALYDLKFAIFPNPTNDQLNISWAGTNDVTLIITNLMGVEVFSQPLQTKNLKIDVSQYPTGIYTVFVKPKTGKRIARKFLVLP